MLSTLINKIEDFVTGKAPLDSSRSKEWPRVRKAHLLIEPICQCCGSGKNLQVHHLQPFHLHPELELDPTNLITLCEEPSKNCHILFGHLRNFKSVNVDCSTDVKLWNLKVKNRPI